MQQTVMRTRLTGYRYVSARMRVSTMDDYMPRDFTPTGRLRFQQIPIVSSYRCDHTQTICSMKDCIMDWGLDWRIFLSRTEGGRNLSARAKLTEQEVMWLADDTPPRRDFS